MCLGLHSFGLPGSARSLWNSWGPPFLTSSLGILAGYGPNERPRTDATSLSTTSTSASPFSTPSLPFVSFSPLFSTFPLFWQSLDIVATELHALVGERTVPEAHATNPRSARERPGAPGNLAVWAPQKLQFWTSRGWLPAPVVALSLLPRALPL